MRMEMLKPPFKLFFFLKKPLSSLQNWLKTAYNYLSRTCNHPFLGHPSAGIVCAPRLRAADASTNRVCPLGVCLLGSVLQFIVVPNGSTNTKLKEVQEKNKHMSCEALWARCKVLPLPIQHVSSPTEHPLPGTRSCLRSRKNKY